MAESHNLDSESELHRKVREILKQTPHPDPEGISALAKVLENAPAEHQPVLASVKRLLEAFTAAKSNPTPASVAELVRAFFSLMMSAPGTQSIVEKALDNPDVQALLRKEANLTVLKAMWRSCIIGTPQEEVLQSVEPFGISQEDRNGLLNVHALLQIHQALELLLGEDYHSGPTADDFFMGFGLTKEEFERLSIDEKRQLLYPGLSQKEVEALPLEELFARPLAQVQRPKTPFIESMYEAVDLLFEQRYGWPAGTARKLSYQELWLALENMLDDKPDDPEGIWKLTS